MSIKRGIDKAVEKVVDELKSMSKPTRDRDEIAQVGTISANNDKTIGDILAEAMDKVGKEVSLRLRKLKDWKQPSISLKACGLIGATSPYFVTDPERMECVYEDVYILIREEDLQHEGSSARS